MQEVIINKLHQYLKENNPDLLLALEEKNDTSKYLADKVRTVDDLIIQLQEANTPEYIIHELCMEELTKAYRPSRYNYIVNILEEDFEFAYQQWQKSGILLHEVINLINYCIPVFDSLGFTEENEDNRQLRYAIAGTIDKYLSK